MKYYGSLCTQIYDLDKPEPAQNELKFYLKYLKNKEMQILEPMCGSGRFLIPILERGYQIDGFDVSEDMLLACEQKAREKNLNCNLKVVKAEDLHQKSNTI
ncbi:class I SAM-dependent methyltransferase [Anaerobacillus sp. CMMVII]|uniref:class I SAM-dependent methyltransferase n=1 Tax=Anaerobacillus sp. CMMVII TaxID=2755588 RepID=UPI0021B7D027|nr:class I SAM-dependent methyltransferase [Anaerobacillus sp. CMMVII]MCT8139339.1 class I SAM-dependent methyltransferase [Anaerobacillus sp. CMMVII]